MPLDIIRLFGSRFHAVATDAEWRAGVTLWAKSFHQVPAASVPDDDIELCRLAELGRDLKAWKTVREVALHGWIKCSDGRLYHPVVSEKANEAWERKQAQRARSAKGNAARWGSRDRDGNESGALKGTGGDGKDHLEAVPEASFKESLKDSEKESCKDPKGQGQGQGQGNLIPSNLSVAPAFPDPEKQQEPTASQQKGPPDCPHGEVLSLWAEVLPHLPQHNPAMWAGTRADHLRARWRDTARLKSWESKADGLAYFRKLFAYVGSSQFLTGRSASAPGKRPFVIELEWLVNPTNWAKVHEGKYHQEAA
jgi:hypothetical protein